MKRISTNRVAQSTKYVVKLCGLFVARVIVSISDCILVTLNQDKKGVYWKTLFSDEPDDSVKDSINTFGAFNTRTGKFDDGTNPQNKNKKHKKKISYQTKRMQFYQPIALCFPKSHQLL